MNAFQQKLSREARSAALEDSLFNLAFFVVGAGIVLLLQAVAP